MAESIDLPSHHPRWINNARSKVMPVSLRHHSERTAWPLRAAAAPNPRACRPGTERSRNAAIDGHDCTPDAGLAHHDLTRHHQDFFRSHGNAFPGADGRKRRLQAAVPTMAPERYPRTEAWPSAPNLSPEWTGRMSPARRFSLRESSGREPKSPDEASVVRATTWCSSRREPHQRM